MYSFYIGLIVLFAALALYCIYDAFDHTDYGFVWLFGFIFCPPLMFVYLAMSLYDRRRASRAQIERTEQERMGSTLRFSSDIERARFIAASEAGAGTLHEPQTGLGLDVPQGNVKFRDERAEMLLAAGDSAEAWDYLSSMYFIAREQGDVQRAAGLRSYLHRVPGGGERLAQWEALGADPGPLVEAAPIPPPPQKRSVPF